MRCNSLLAVCATKQVG